MSNELNPALEPSALLETLEALDLLPWSKVEEEGSSLPLTALLTALAEKQSTQVFVAKKLPFPLLCVQIYIGLHPLPGTRR